jgi:zinc transport system substrate-binding protein
MDPHVWSSPRAMLPLADSVALALVRLYPDCAVRIQANRDSVHAQLLKLDTLVRTELAPYSGKHFYINHPELGYLAHDYGLVQEPLEEGGREPSLAFLLEARKVARTQGIRAVFVETAYGTRTAQAMAGQMQVPTVELDLYAAPWDSSIVRVVRTLAANL